jgi:hypothetical protein
MPYTAKWLICMTFSSVDFSNRELLLLPIANHYSKQFTCFRRLAAYPKRQRSKLSGEAEPGVSDFCKAGIRDLRRE